MSFIQVKEGMTNGNIVATRKGIESMESKNLFRMGRSFRRRFTEKSGLLSGASCHNGRFLCVVENKQDAIELIWL
ncbi:MAG: hypothetical protein R3B65_03005 [Candidatus Paceibacterota bacterium]